MSKIVKQILTTEHWGLASLKYGPNLRMQIYTLIKLILFVYLESMYSIDPIDFRR